MSATLWDTTGTDVVKALAAERRAAGGVASGLALTLVVVADEKRVSEAEQAATTAAAMHPCRLLIVVRRKLEADDRLDAEVAIGGRLGPTEAVVMRMHGRLTLHAESVVLPLLAPDAPVVTWWVGAPPDQIAHDPLGVLADRRITDVAQAADPLAALRVRASDYAPGDTDLAWTRATGWRALLASAFDALDAPAAKTVVRAEAGNASAALLSAWLGHRLGCEARLEDSKGPGITEVEVELGDGQRIVVNRPDGRMATLARGEQPERALPLPRRDLGDLLAEELRRMDADQPYADALAAATGSSEDLSARDAQRTHVWVDPAQEAAAEANA